MAEQKALIIENDLFFTSKITNTVKEVGLAPVIAQESKAVNQQLKDPDLSLIIIDLSLNGLDTLKLLNNVKGSQSTCHIPIIAFAEHTEKELLQGAREAGCEIVITNLGIAKDLKDLIEAALPEPSL